MSHISLRVVEHPGRHSWAERYFLVILIGTVAFFMTISLVIGLNQSVWFDEAYSILVAKQSVGQAIHLASVDTHPPFFYLLLKLWAGVFGWSELALRSLSVVAAAGAVVFAGLLARRLFGVRAALISLCFVALAPFLIRYGFEIRMYAFASLVGIAATYVLVCAVEARGRQQWALYVLYAALAGLGMYTLYYLALLWLAHFVWLVYLWRLHKKPFMKAPWLLAYAGSVGLFLPWLPSFFRQVSNGALAQISQPLTLDNLLGIISFSFVSQPVWQLGALTSIVVVFVLIAGSYFTVKAFREGSVKQRQSLGLLACYVLVPVLILTLVSLIKPMYVERYLAHVLIGGYLFIGVAVALGTHKARLTSKVVGGLLLSVCVLGIVHLGQVGNFNYQRMEKPTVKQISQAIDCHAAPVLAADPYVAIELMYYLPDCQIHFYSETATLSGGYAPLSDSPLHTGDPVQSFGGAKKLSFVYYGEPQLTLPTQLAPSDTVRYGALTLTTFSEE